MASSSATNPSARVASRRTSAHEAGCAFSKATAMVACERPYPVVVTTNSGYPLDQNLYQAVKGISAADGMPLAPSRYQRCVQLTIPMMA